ncbi:NAD-dependent protein deacetylase [Enemella sp. A6]|uniref:NAD-dependent protein deacetylase n=1 Tax=Enemella sp. A6 TaxID=3440152 RepID=UPI003EB9E9CC
MTRLRHRVAGWGPTPPSERATTPEEMLRARRLVTDARRLVVLTGAGISTNSGVPDYRGPDAPQATPMLYGDFVANEADRRRYWARAYVGWQRMGMAVPNSGHRLVADLENSRPHRFGGLITQNVDGLHEAAGSHGMIALHGRIADVICLDCARLFRRTSVQQWLAELNPDVDTDRQVGHAELRPDGDAVVDEWQNFVVPPCPACGGVLKPDVVFFGEPVPTERVRTAIDWVDRADCLLVVGSSLTVMSGLRFVRQAAAAGTDVVIVNRGKTRGDDLATVKIDGDTSETLQFLL